MDFYSFVLQSYTIILLISTTPFVVGTNINCNGKAFHCVNSTHFKICVDLGGGVSTTVDEFLIPCPRNTVCKQYNIFECEYDLSTPRPPLTVQGDVTNKQFRAGENVRERLDATTLFPIKQQQGMELSEKYYNALNTTPESLNDAVKYPVSSSNTNDLLSGSYSAINKTLNTSQSIEKELISSATESGMTQTSPYFSNTYVSDISISSNYNTETPVSHSTTEYRRSQTDLLKSEILEPLNQNNLDFDARLTVTKRTNEVSSVSELQSDTVTLLPDSNNNKFNNPFLQENTSQTTNINRLNNIDKTSQDNNLDILIKYNTTEINNLDNNIQNLNINTSMYSINTSAGTIMLNSTKPTVFIDEIYSNDISNINERSTVKSSIASQPSRRHLVETATASITNELSSTISPNTIDENETILNVGFNTNLEKISVTDGYIVISTPIIPELTTVKSNEIVSQRTNSELNYRVSSVASTNPILEDHKAALSDKPPTLETNSSKITNADDILYLKNISEINFTTELNSINISQYFTTTEPYSADVRNDTQSSSISISDIISPKSMGEVLNLNSKEATKVNNVSQIDNVNTVEKLSTNTDAPNETFPNLNYLDEVLTNNTKNLSNSIILFNNSLFTTPTSKYAISDEIIIEDYKSTSINKLSVLTTVNMANETQVPAFNLSNDLMSKVKTKDYSTTNSVVPLTTTQLLTTFTSESAISDKVVGDGFSSTGDDMFPVLRKGDVTTETQVYLTVLDESVTENPDNYSTSSTLYISENFVATKYPKKESNLNYLLSTNNSTIHNKDISLNYNTKLKVMTNNRSIIVDTLPTPTTKTISSLDQTTGLISRITEEDNLIAKESYVMKENINKTWPEPVMVTVATDLAESNITTSTEISNNVTDAMSTGLTSSKSISDSISKDETPSKPVAVVVASGPENKNVTTISNNVTEAMSTGLASLKSISDSISKDETPSKPVAVVVATGPENKNVTKISNNVTEAMSTGLASLKSTSDSISKDETQSKPVAVVVATGPENKNVTKISNNVTEAMSTGLASLKSTSDSISKDETQSKPVAVVVATGPENKNVTKISNNVTEAMSTGLASLKSTSDSISKDETQSKPVAVVVATGPENKNVTKISNNVTEAMSTGLASLKSTSDSISKDETPSKPVAVVVATGPENKNVTKISNNVTEAMSTGLASLKSTSDSISKDETQSKPVAVVVATGPENKNVTKISNNVTEAMSTGFASLKSISDSISTTSKIKPTVSQLLTATDSIHKEYIGTTRLLTDNQSFNESTTTLSSPAIIPDYVFKTKQVDIIDSSRLITSTESVISDIERERTSITTSLPATLHKATNLTDGSSGAVENNNTKYNDVTIKSVINSLYRVNQALNPVSTLRNTISVVYETTTENIAASTMAKPLIDTTVSNNSTDLTNNTIDVLSEYIIYSDNNKSRETKFKLESMITANPSNYYDSNITSSKQVTSLRTITVTTPSSESDKQELEKKQIYYEKTYGNGKIIRQNIIDNLNSTELSIENKQTSVTTDNYTVLRDLNIDTPNKINNSLRDIDNRDLNFTDKNVTSALSSNSKSISLKNVHSRLVNSSLTDIHNVSQHYYSVNLTTTNTFGKTNVSNEYNETEYKKLSQINKNEPARFNNNIKYGGNKTEYPLVNSYKQVTTTSKDVKDKIFEEISYNFSEPLLTVSKNASHNIFVKNITLTAAYKNNSVVGSGFNTSNIITKNISVNVETNRSKLADYFDLSEIPNNKRSGNGIKPLLTVQKSLQEVNNTTSLHTESKNLSLITGYGFKKYVSDTMNNSKINKNDTVNRSKFIAFVKNKTSSDNFYEDVINSWRIENPPLEANSTKPTKTFTYDRNASDNKSIKIIRTKENYTNKSSTTANEWVKNTTSQIYSIQNKTHREISTPALQFPRIMPSKFERSSQTIKSLNTSKMEITSLVSNITKLELISKQQSNGTEKKESQNSHGHTESILSHGITGITRSKTLQIQNGFTPTSNMNYSVSNYTNLRTKQEFRCTKRGKYSDTNHCSKFFICIGRIQPIIGVCPTNTVFSESLKQCTKNVTHCIKNNLFKCTAAGRFINRLSNNTYFICAKNKSGFIRFTLQCQKGYYLNKNNIKCTSELFNISKSDENSSKSTKELSVEINKKMKEVSVNSKNYYECEREGKFNDPLDCRKYYVCKKGRDSVFRRKVRKCDSDEVFHRKKKKCVDEESYECDI